MSVIFLIIALTNDFNHNFIGLNISGSRSLLIVSREYNHVASHAGSHVIRLVHRIFNLIYRMLSLILIADHCKMTFMDQYQILSVIVLIIALTEDFNHNFIGLNISGSHTDTVYL